MRQLAHLFLLVLLLGAPAEAGWAIQRSDGTFRAWNANTQDDALQPGESWVKLDTPPVVTPPAGGPQPPLCSAVTGVVSDPTVPASVKALAAQLKASNRCP